MLEPTSTSGAMRAYSRIEEFGDAGRRIVNPR